jgi:hypothetical protein
MGATYAASTCCCFSVRVVFVCNKAVVNYSELVVLCLQFVSGGLFMGARHYDRRNFYERRIARFEMTDMMEDGIFMLDQGGRVWVNNDNGYYTPQVAVGAEKIVVISINEAYRRAKIVRDGHRQLIARRRSIGGPLDRIKFEPK